ncbi:MAG: TetR/AcrR family transcriptional regulator [Bacteroidetes bacterium]|nr:TetR/AcrR family transcriptional regulator [Bacteroidota bacterium]
MCLFIGTQTIEILHFIFVLNKTKNSFFFAETLVTKKVSLVLHPIMEVKERILEKAADLFMRYGIRSITMDEIAAQLAISKKTIYQFFTDKDEIVEAVVTEEINKNEDECERFKQFSDDALHEIFLAMDKMEEMMNSMNPLIMYDLEKHHPKSFKRFKNHKYQFMYSVIKANLERGILEENYRSDLNVDVVTRHRIESAFMSFNQDVFPHNKYKISELCYELAVLYLYSITTSKGKKLIEKYLTERKKQIAHEQKV